MPEMTADQFRQWRERHGLSRTGAAETLGLGRNQPERYEDKGQPIPKYIALACAAIDAGISVPSDE